MGDSSKTRDEPAASQLVLFVLVALFSIELGSLWPLIGWAAWWWLRCRRTEKAESSACDLDGCVLCESGNHTVPRGDGIRGGEKPPKPPRKIEPDPPLDGRSR